MPEFQLFLPQMRTTPAALVERARAAEQAGFGGIALMDHLAPPLAEQMPMYDAMLAASWIAARTDRLRIGHLVLCDAFRHPAVLAKQAVTLDHLSAGRFELGIGWGSVVEELEAFGVGETAASVRVARLRETLEVVRALWSGDAVDYAGEHHRLRAARQQPPPLDTIPVLIGGAGPRTLRLVAEHADWWNCPVYALDRFEELRSQTGGARASLQEMVAFAPEGSDANAVRELALRRFPNMAVRPGDGAELRDHYAALAARGVERVYVWFSDFADPETLAAFGREVIAPLRADAAHSE